MNRRIMLIPAVAERTGMPEGTLRFLRHEGKGPRSFKVGRRVAYYEDDVDAWLDEQYAATSRGGAVTAPAKTQLVVAR
ncbi:MULTISPECIES: helix-turn-helix transcriptional regulator [unclassified Isoptericola]|uniref:helix-turn-helix transcriptional regulator n=1 Tax=unclassified Isoptericola TaxID=2623355 RepID=UPI00365E9AE1